MIRCPVCTDHNFMKKCKACGKVWCSSCAFKGGQGQYPKQTAADKCPYCNTQGKFEKAQ